MFWGKIGPHSFLCVRSYSYRLVELVVDLPSGVWAYAAVLVMVITADGTSPSTSSGFS